MKTIRIAIILLLVGAFFLGLGSQFAVSAQEATPTATADPDPTATPILQLIASSDDETSEESPSSILFQRSSCVSGGSSR